MDGIADMLPQDIIPALAPAGLPPYVVPLALGAALLLLVLWLVLRARVPRKARPAGERGGVGRRLSRATAGGVRGLVGELLAVGRYLTTRREWRYRQPWVVMLGERGAGKSSITESISAGRRETLLAKEQRLTAPDSEWLFFNRGVLIDIGGDTADCDEGGRDRRRWHEVLESLDQHRPERPVDAAVLTLSARSLLGAGGADLHALAERLYRQLWEMQQRLDLTFPVYLVVGQCDAVPGFHAFWDAQPEALRRQILGWSNPHALNLSFSPEWVDGAFATLDQTLSGLQMNAAASGATLNDPDRFFLFPRRFQALAAPLKVVLGQLFRHGALHEAFYFRGLYFTGAIDERLGDDTEGRAANPPGERTDIAFVDELFDERIFRELNLARPTRQGVLSRNRFIRRFQFTMMALAAALVLTLGISTWSLNQQIDAAGKAHRLVTSEAPNHRPGEPCIRRAPLYELLENVARIQLNLSYWSIPASWFDRRVNTINRKEIADGAFEGVIFPAMACRLEARAQRLNEKGDQVNPLNDPGAEATEQTLAALRDYTAEAASLARDIALFRDLAHRNEDTEENFNRFATLISGLYQAPLPAPLKESRGLLRAALAHVEYKTPLKLPKGLDRRVAKVMGGRAVAAADQLQLRLRHGSTLLRTLEGHPSLDDIRRIYGWLHQVRDEWLDGEGSNPCAALRQQLAPDLATLAEHGFDKAGGDTLGAPLAAAVAGPFDHKRCDLPARGFLATLRIAPYGPLFSGEGDAMRVTPWMERELSGFEALLELDFMKVKAELPFQCRLPIRGWNEASLSEAARYLRGWEAFAKRFDLSLDGADPKLFERTGRLHLSAVVDHLFTTAQRRQRLGESGRGFGGGLASLSAAEQEVESKSDAFQRLLDPLILTLDQYRRLGFGTAQSRILQCARDYAGDTLGRIETLAEGSRLYEVSSNLGPLDPDTPYFDLGTTAQTKAWLARQLSRGQVLTGYATPFVTFLGNSAPVNDAKVGTVDSGAYWDGTIDEINRLVQFKDPTSQAAELEGFITNQLSTLTQSNCHGVLSDYPRPAYGNDLFSRHRDQLTFLADWYCRDHAVAGVLDDYQGLAQRFNGELAGRFPFGPLETSDADPTLVRNFFHDYAQLRAPLGASLEALDGPEWAEVRAFIAALDGAAELFTASLAAADGERPLALKVGFRHLPKRSPGSEQVISWQLDAGLESAVYPNGADQVNWRFGDPLSLSLTWAELSPVAPIADGDQPDLGVSGRSASFTADGPWALLRLTRRHRQASLSDTSQEVLRFTVPVRMSGSVPRHATALHARMYLALTAGAIDPKTQAETPLALPAGFPTSAPMPR